MTANADQDYTTIKTPTGGQIVKLRNYTTLADKEAIRTAYADGTDVTIQGDGAAAEAKTKVDASVDIKVDRIRVERFVVDIDGDATGLVEKIYGMRQEDGEAVIEAIKKITASIGGLGSTEKKD